MITIIVPQHLFDCNVFVLFDLIYVVTKLNEIEHIFGYRCLEKAVGYENAKNRLSCLIWGGGDSEGAVETSAKREELRS